MLNIEGYSDKDSRKSITGMVIYLCGVPIVWKSKGLKAVTLSTTESEHYAISELCPELLYIKQIWDFLRIKVKFPMIVRVDNIGTMFLSNNAVLSQRTKHTSFR